VQLLVVNSNSCPDHIAVGFNLVEQTLDAVLIWLQIIDLCISVDLSVLVHRTVAVFVFDYHVIVTSEAANHSILGGMLSDLAFRAN
jgi:hypothetical protein